ncbi:MAG: cupin domain-containing protein, partial [Tannerellaceae bacterium]|nr:cupin domain-containing protein [Tannerellaceae bacterium]
MRRINILLGVISIAGLISCNHTNTANEESIATTAEKELIFDRGDKIESPHFTGDAWLNNLIMPDDENQNAVGSVTFAPGARTNWHSHPAGQIILALDGVGYYQEKGKPVEIIRKGEVVKCPHNTPPLARSKP